MAFRAQAQLEKFEGVDIYEYEQPEHFDDDEEIDEDDVAPPP